MHLFIPFFVGLREVLTKTLQVMGFFGFVQSLFSLTQVDVCEDGLTSPYPLALVRLVFHSGGLISCLLLGSPISSKDVVKVQERG